MGKDPALMLYTSDFLTGTMLFNDAQVGKYVRTLCLMHQQKGQMPRDDFDAYVVDPKVRNKFDIGQDVVTNARLSEEMKKRSTKSSHLSDNANKRWHKTSKSNAIASNLDMPIEDENVNEGESKNNNTLRASWFDEIWNQYPSKVGRKAAEKHFLASVETEQDFANIKIALKHYLESERVFNGFKQNGSTWFNGWRDWITHQEPVCQKCHGKGKFISTTGYESICGCPKGKSTKIRTV